MGHLDVRAGKEDGRGKRQEFGAGAYGKNGKNGQNGQICPYGACGGRRSIHTYIHTYTYIHIYTYIHGWMDGWMDGLGRIGQRGLEWAGWLSAAGASASLACLPACLPTCLSAYLPVCLPACLPACLLPEICFGPWTRVVLVRGKPGCRDMSGSVRDPRAPGTVVHRFLKEKDMQNTKTVQRRRPVS